jgi:hypothetical protein
MENTTVTVKCRTAIKVAVIFVDAAEGVSLNTSSFKKYKALSDNEMKICLDHLTSADLNLQLLNIIHL